MDIASDSKPSDVRTAARLLVDSPRTTNARSESSDTPEALDVEMEFDFKAFGLRAIDGELVRKYLQAESGTQEGQNENPAAGNPKDTQIYTDGMSHTSRLQSLLRALELTYKNPSGTSAASASSVITGDGWNSLLPNGPFAVAVLTGPQTTTGNGNLEPPIACNPGSDLTGPSQAAVFPPIWLPTLSRSLTFLDLSSSPYLDPSTWDLSALARLPRLAFICLRHATVVSPLPAGLATCLPALRVVDLCDATFNLRQEEVAAMLLSLSSSEGTSDADGASPSRHLVVVTADDRSSDTRGMLGWGKKRLDILDGAKGNNFIIGLGPALRIKYEAPGDTAESGGGGGHSSSTRTPDSMGHTQKIFSDAVRAVRATREKLFLDYARQSWWTLLLEFTALVPQPLDISMVRLVYDLGLLPPLAELQPQARVVANTAASGPQDVQDAEKNEDFGAEFVISERAPAQPSGAELVIDCTALALAWPYACSRWDTPTWSHKQRLHSHFRKDFKVFLSSRQWKLLMDETVDCSSKRLESIAASAGRDTDDPFGVAVLAFQALEDRERLMGATLFAACTGSALGMMSLGNRFTSKRGSSALELTVQKALLASKARPQPGCKVVVPTAAALAARSLARRLLVAGLLGEGLAAVSPAQGGAVSRGSLLVALRLETRLYARVRRVSILPRSHAAYAATHIGRYWSSVQSLHNLLCTDALVRRGVLTGTIPLDAATEIPAAELRALIRKMDKLARKGATVGHAGGNAALLAEKAILAADAADLDALVKQASIGGRLDEQIPIFTEDWQPSEQSADSLCAWHIDDPWVWPHGTVLHNAVALGHVRTASWLLERGLDVDSRISRWKLTPLHLCCLRPCIWQAGPLMLKFLRVPASSSHNDGLENGVSRVKGGDSDEDEIEDEDRGGSYQRLQRRIMNHQAMNSASVKKFDRKLGIPEGYFAKCSALLFPGVCQYDNIEFGPRLLLGPLWFSVDDEVTPLLEISSGRIQAPSFRTLQCTRPAVSSDVRNTATTAVSTAGLSAAASPMLRLLLNHEPDVNARSWCGLLPIHYAAATCGPEMVIALAEEGATLQRPLPGTLISPLNLLACRSTRRWSGLSPRAAVELLCCQPVIPAEEVVARMDEWRGSPLSWLLRDPDMCPAPGLLHPLLKNIRQALGPPQGAGSGTASDSKAGLFKEALCGVARALCCAIVVERVEHVRVLLQHFPEAVSATLAPMNVSPLHIACYMVAWKDLSKGHLLRCTVVGEEFQGIENPPPAIMEYVTPYVPPGGVSATIAASKPLSGGGSSPGSVGVELLLLGADPSPAPNSCAGEASGSARTDGRSTPTSSAEDGDCSPYPLKWHCWPYPLILQGPKVHGEAGETESSAMQRCSAAQLQIVRRLLDAGAPVDAQDACGCTPLIVAALTASPAVVSMLLERGASLNIVAQYASPKYEPFTRKRLERTRAQRETRVLGLDLLLFASYEEPQQDELERQVRAWRKAENDMRKKNGEQIKKRLAGDTRAAGKEAEEAKSSHDSDADDEEAEVSDDDDDDDDNTGSRVWIRPRYGAKGDGFLGYPMKFTAPYEALLDKAVLTPTTASVMRHMRYYSCSRHHDETGPGTGMQIDGNISSYHFALDKCTDAGARLSRFGDGILYLMLRHGSPEFRESVLGVLSEATTSNIVDEMPRTAIWVLQKAMPGNHYVSYADRAAREASNSISALNLSSLEGAIQKGLGLALKEAGLVGRNPHKRAEEKAKAAEVLSSGAPPWGPYEDEVLNDLMTTGLYPLFMSQNVTNGEASVLRMSAQLLKFANHISVSKRALLQAHIRQFTRDGMSHSVVSGGGGSGGGGDPQTVVTAIWALDNIELLPAESFNYACKLSQQRVRTSERRRALSPGAQAENGGAGGSAAASGSGDGHAATAYNTDGRNRLTVLALHTLDDIEYGLTYSRAMELLPPVTSMRMSFGHCALMPHIIIRSLAESLFKFVRTLCHVAQTELNWVRLPGGVTYTAVDGLFLPVLPGESDWNITDLFRPRNFGFRLSFAYTRRTLTVELHAMSLMRSVPINIAETDGGSGPSGTAGITSPRAGGRATAGDAAMGDEKGEAENGPIKAVLARRAGAAPVNHNRHAEFGYWIRNPDVVRMDQIQSMAGRFNSTARKVGGDGRQMPAPPPWWISGWVDRFLRLFLFAALSGEDDKNKRLKLHNVYDTSVQDPWTPNIGAAAPWSKLETNVLATVLSLHPLAMGQQEKDGEELKDLAGRPISEKDMDQIRKILVTPTCESMVRMSDDSNPDRGCITFTAQWNALAQERKWPLRSTWEILDVVMRLVRMSCCSYTSSWLPSMQVMFEILMNGETSAELRRETEAKLLSLASDATFARRLVWGTCRGRRADARALAFLSSVVEFQPLLIEALLEHEAQCDALEKWSQEVQYWAVAGGPVLETMDADALSLLLQENYDLDYRPLIVPYKPITSPQTAAGSRAAAKSSTGRVGGGGDEAAASDHQMCMAYCRFRSHADLECAVSGPVVVPGSYMPGRSKSASGGGTDTLLALLPVSLWEAGTVTSSQIPHRNDTVALPFFSLVFSRLPHGLQRSDPHAAGMMWGTGVQAVLLHRRPGPYRWSAWGSPPDVSEEAGVVSTLFDAHAAEALPKSWMQELDVNDDGVVTYREFLLAYLRHKGGDFLGPRLGTATKAALQDQGLSGTAGAAAADFQKVDGSSPTSRRPSGIIESTGRASDPAPSAGLAGAQSWQRAARGVAQEQLSQAFWDRANALHRLRNRDGEALVAAQQDGLLRAERALEGQASKGGAGGHNAVQGSATGAGTGMGAMRQLGARALEVLGSNFLGPGSSGSSLPLVALPGLDSVAPEELSEVQRCAWITYGNLRTAARYLQNVQADGYMAANGKDSDTAGLTPWQAAERTAVDSVMRGLHQPQKLFGKQEEADSISQPAVPMFGPGGPTSWLQALSGSLNSNASTPNGRCQVRDSVLLELLVDLAASSRLAVHEELLSEGSDRPVGPMAGVSPLLMGRQLAATAAQLGADAADEVANAVGALALDIASEGAGKEGLAVPVGGLDGVFCASAIRLAAEEIWAFVTDMQALSDLIISPLVAAADQSVPIIERESITTIFGETNIEIILEYEIEILKLLTVQWRVGARTGLVVSSVAGPAQYLVGTAQRRLAASRLRAYAGDFPPSAEQLGLDRLASGVQLRAVLTDPGVAGEVLELLLRLATAYQNYLDHIDAALQELLACVDRDEKGTLTALLRRFSRPVKLRTPKATATPAEGGQPDGGEENSDIGSSDDDGLAKDDDKVSSDAVKDGAASAGSATGGEQRPGSAKKESKDRKKESNGQITETKRLIHPPIHNVRPLLSVRQMARYGAGAELEACLRKPASHLASLAFLATVCRSISHAQEQLAVVEAAVAGGEGGAGEVGTASAGPLGPVPAPAVRTTSTAAASGAQRDSRFPFGFGKAPNGGTATGDNKGAPISLPVASLRARRTAGATPGLLRRAWQLILGVRVTKVLPLGASLHPLFQLPSPGPGGIPRAVAAATAEHRVALRCIGAAVLSAEGAAGKLSSAPLLGERLDAWMEERLLAGNFASRVLLVVCTALTCLTWRVVPLLSERRRYLEDLRVANNLLHHRHVVRQLERAINVRPHDDEELDGEVSQLHKAIQKGIEDTAKEVDFGEGDVEKLSPMNLDSGFWAKSGPKRINDPVPLRAALKLAEERTLHSTFAGARLLSNARRCAAHLTTDGGGGAWAGIRGGGAAGKGKHKGGGGAQPNAQGADSDLSDDAERVVDAIVATGPVKRAPPPPSKKPSAAAVVAGGAKGAAEAKAAAGGGPIQLARMFGAKPREGGGAAGEPKAAWGALLGGGGMAAAVGVVQQVKQFGGALRRAVRRREHARRRWDKTLFLVMQSGALDETFLAREHAREVARLHRTAALLAWKQLRGAFDDMLMVFGEVVFRDVSRLFALAMAGFLMGFPFVVLGTAIQVKPNTSHERLNMGILVGAYVIIGFCGMVLAVAQLRRDPSQLKVYRPSDTIRFPNFRKGTTLSSWKAHWVNVFALVTLVLEFWQLCAFSYQRRIPYPKTSFLKQIFPWALLDLGPAAYFLQVFALLAFMIVWIAVFFPQTPGGLKRVIMPFLGQAAYLTITSGLLSQLDCNLDNGVLIRNPDITCWTEPRHLYGAVAAMLALGLYVPRATLTPFEVFFPSENLDIKYRGLYVRVVQLLRLGMAGYNLFFAESHPLKVMLANACVCALLAIMTALMWPCCIGAVNIGRGTGFVLATWSQVVSAAALKLASDFPDRITIDHRTRQWYTSDWRYVYVLVSGWVAIAAVGYWLLRRYLRRMDSAAIRFSLKTSPFNYTLPLTSAGLMETAASLASQRARAVGTTSQRKPPQLPQPPPPSPGVAGTRAATEAPDSSRSQGSGAGDESGAGAGTGALDAVVTARRTESSIGASGEDEEGGSGVRTLSQRSSSTCEAGGKSVASSKRVGDGDGDRDGESGDDGADSKHTTSGNADLGDALGLPTVSPKLIGALAAQGLLTPADEMRAFMAQLARRKESNGESSDDGKVRHSSGDDSD